MDEDELQSPVTIRRDGHDVQLRSSLDVRVTEHVDGFSGYAATFWVADSYGTAMAPGSFKRSIKQRGDRIPVLWNHNPDTPVGKHLEIKEDQKGLYVNIGIADDGAEGTTLLSRLRFGVPLGMSFGFRRIQSRAGTNDDPIDLSYLPKGVKKTDIEVYTENAYWESSPVTFPANETATIDAIRSLRSDIDAGALASLIEHIRAGSLSDEHAALVADLVAAFNDRSDPDPGTPTPLPETSARHRIRAAQGLLTLRQHGITIGGTP